MFLKYALNSEILEKKNQRQSSSNNMAYAKAQKYLVESKLTTKANNRIQVKIG